VDEESNVSNSTNSAGSSEPAVALDFCSLRSRLLVWRLNIRDMHLIASMLGEKVDQLLLSMLLVEPFGWRPRSFELKSTTMEARQAVEYRVTSRETRRA
jgi:hypothetical protein